MENTGKRNLCRRYKSLISSSNLNTTGTSKTHISCSIMRISFAIRNLKAMQRIRSTYSHVLPSDLLCHLRMSIPPGHTANTLQHITAENNVFPCFSSASLYATIHSYKYMVHTLRKGLRARDYV